MSEHRSTPRLSCPVCAAVYRAQYVCCPSDGTTLLPCTRDPLRGRILESRYVIEALLGEGAMGAVYRAVDMSSRRTIAIKIMHGELAADARSRLRLEREFEVMRKLNHPNVVSVIAYASDSTAPPHLVMEYSAGETLRQIVEREAPMRAGRTVDIGRQLAAGLSHVHAAGLIHRDLKPENIILERRQRGKSVPRIVDFGLAISQQDLSHASARLTATGYAMGTPSYVAPEQLQKRCVDRRADLFSLGVILYELLVAKTPFDGTIPQVVYGSVSGNVPPMKERNPLADVAAPLEAVVRRLLASDPDGRFQTADDVVSALRTVGRILAR